LISVLVNVLGMKKLEPTVKLSLYSALVLFIMAIFTITLDLGHPERAIEVLYRPQFHSVLEDVVMIYVIYFVLLVVELLLSFRFDLIEGRLDSLGGSARIKKLISRLLQPSASSPESLERSARLIRRSFLYLGAFGLIIALLFIAGEGALVGTVYYSEPWWTGPLFPILYIAGALYSGAALFIVILMALWPRKDEEFREMIAYLGRIVYWLLIGNAVLTSTNGRWSCSWWHSASGCCISAIASCRSCRGQRLPRCLSRGAGDRWVPSAVMRASLS